MFQTPAYIQTIRTLVDGGIKLDVITRELPPEQALMLFSLKGKEGFFLFSLNDIQEKDVPKETAMVEKGEKTPSQRLRAVLFKLYELNNKGETFTEYYNKKMEQLIESIKEKL